MIISLIVAMDEKGGIGKDGSIPWRLSADLKLFKQTTMGHHLVMGRLTYESIGHPLPGRTNIVVTRNPDYQAPGCLLAHSVAAALALAESRGETEVFVIGGGQIYSLALRLADRIYLSRVHAQVDCDVFFPEFDERDWVEMESAFYPADEKNQYPFTFQLLGRRELTP
ncbi:MAG: dihydrofolate reductase [Anaerolineales bacterium]|nr:dihydrofolate reductase [Anaerolineales bacterium]